MEKPVRIRIENLRLRTIIGINEWERNIKQDIIISVTFTYDAAHAIKDDDIERAVNYKELTKKIISTVEKSQYKLLESLADSVLDIIKEYKGIGAAEVAVDKPHALRYCDTVQCSMTI